MIKSHRLTISPHILKYIRESTNKSLEKYKKTHNNYNEYNYDSDSLLVSHNLTTTKRKQKSECIYIWHFIMGVFVGYHFAKVF